MPITFVIPVRHHLSVPDWDRAQRNLVSTVDSVRGQTAGSWQCVVVANEDTPLPWLPEDVTVVRVDRPYEPLPDWSGGTHEVRRNEAVREDKGARILAGIVAVQPTGHVMVVDYDDFVSCRLAELSASDPDAPGWVIDCGYAYDGHPLVYLKRRGFNDLCGTSLIVHSRLLGLERGMATDPAHVRRTLGSHVFLAGDLMRAGTPLATCPFPGAVYRVGNPGSASGSPSVRRMFFRRRRLTSNPGVFVRRLANVRPTRAVARHFGLPTRG